VTDPPSFQVDARLPNPTIITCNERLPLRILVQKLSESTVTVFLSMLQIELIGYTHVRAHDLTRSESRSWVIMSQSNMNIPLGEPTDPVGKEWKVPSRYWENIPLPNTVAPSFETCNLSRTYELEVRVGLSHGIGLESIKPEIIVLPLRLAVKVYSGIAPPAALLHRIATSHPQTQNQFATAAAQGAPVPLSPASFYPPTPITPSYAQHQPPAPAGTTAYFQSSRPPQPPNGVDDDDDAPPSYEDAMADEIAPVDGPRRDYSVPTQSTGTNSISGTDSKTGSTSGPASQSGGGGGGISGLGRRVSERLFPQNDTSTPTRRAGRGTRNRSNSRQSSSDDGEFGASGAVAADGNIAAKSRGGAPQQPVPRVARKLMLPPSFEESTAGRGRG
jgi:hypothetical protein